MTDLFMFYTNSSDSEHPGKWMTGAETSMDTDISESTAGAVARPEGMKAECPNQGYHLGSRSTLLTLLSLLVIRQMVAFTPLYG